MAKVKALNGSRFPIQKENNLTWSHSGFLNISWLNCVSALIYIFFNSTVCLGRKSRGAGSLFTAVHYLLETWGHDGCGRQRGAEKERSVWQKRKSEKRSRVNRASRPQHVAVALGCLPCAGLLLSQISSLTSVSSTTSFQNCGGTAAVSGASPPKPQQRGDGGKVKL